MNNRISKRGLDRAGKIIQLHQDDEEHHAAVELLNRWREQHILPMDHYFDACNDIVSGSSAYKGTVVAERLKRLPTIIDKLDRFPNMHLSTMYDIGGVRVILEDIPRLVEFESEARKLDGLKITQCKDYLAKPKDSGYRGRHLIFGRDGMLVEMQLRTRIQHLWATSVETVDVIRGTSMKTKQSDSYWQKFFELASSAFAYMENLPMLPQHRGWDVIRLRDEIRAMMNQYSIEENLEAYEATYRAIEGHEQAKDSYYAVVTFNSCNNETSISYYPEDNYQEAAHRYEELENRMCNNNVLVSVSDLKKLRDAYPNYFKDISRFRELIKAMLDFEPEIR